MTPQQIEAYVDAAAAVHGLALDPAHRPGVLQFFALAAAMADTVARVPLSPHDESAVHFTPLAVGGTS
ncbi:DUF4089 domain-containing protein [Pseudorhodoferax sp.]|uniref:DUF4089 domain-containing protein n=1 Tax=Pseudorhodoferax sp. TaxID=1993553 RepID=UPI002DD69784|nr:DUF4089 domain-containing protein [Pseudorhodoferax sp.]